MRFMKKIPEKFILKIQPSEYLKQGLSHCGAYCVKGICSAFRIDHTKHPKEYHSHFIGRLTGVTLGKNYYPKIFVKCGVNAVSKTAQHFSDVEKIRLIKKILLKGNPIMLCIGNGYLPNGKYSRVLGFFVSHWITIWGYEGKKQTFYIYDSCVTKKSSSKEIPIGNIERSYTQLLRDWKGSILARLFISNEYYRYIEIQAKNSKVK